MPMRRRAPRRKRPARRPRRRVPRGLKAPRNQLKHYNYSFELAPQAIFSSITTAGQVGVESNSGIVPIAPAPNGFALCSNSLNISASITDWAAACSFRLSDIVNAGAFQSMYDAYKINSVTVTLEYLNNMAAVNGSGILPSFYMYWDQDDAALPTSAGQISAKQGHRKWQPTADHTKKSFTFRPQCRNTVESDGGEAATSPSTNAVVPMGPQWLNCQFPRIPHYGFKLYCQDWLAVGQTTSYNILRVHYRYNVSFRSPLITA